MKYTIEGFSQQAAHELGLDALDLIILRWFVDFKDSGNMRAEFIDGEKYYWINHKKLCAELPILDMKTNAFYRRLRKISDAGVLKKVLVKANGSYTYYAIGHNFIKLISPHSSTSKSNKSKINQKDIDSILSDISNLQSDCKGDLKSFDKNDSSLEVSHLSLDNTTSSLESNAIFSGSSPSSLESTALSLESTPLSLEQTPSSLEMTPLSSKSSPLSLEPTPISLEQTPISLETTPPSLESTPSSLESNQIINLSNKSITYQYQDDTSAEVLLSQLMWSLIKKNNPSFKKPNLDNWARAFDVILNNDERNFQEVTELIKWIYIENGFWASQILNPWRFRDVYEKVLARKNFEESKKKVNSDILNLFSCSDLTEFEDM